MEQTDSTAAFFAELGSRGHEPLLSGAKGVVRFELVDDKQTRRWSVDIDRGAVSVSRRAGPADCIVRTDKALFDRVVTGDANALASFLRGRIDVSGNSNLLVSFQRLFGQPGRTAASPFPARSDSDE